MGMHAFETEPEHSRTYRQIQQPPLPRLYGLREGWDMPVVRHRAVLAEDSVFTGVPHYTLTYHIAGAPVRRMDRVDLDRVARTGAVSLQLPGSLGRFRSEEARPVEYAHLYFRATLLEEVHDALRDDGALARPEDDFFGLIDLAWQRDILAYLERARDQRCPPLVGEMDMRARLIIFGLLRLVGRGDAVAEARRARGLTEAQVARVEAFVLSRLGETIRLAELAETVRLSPYHFARRFKVATGETPGSFILRLRLEAAARMLRESDRSISAIAFATGFSSQSHLSRRIKEAHGVTPAELRHR